MFGSRPVRQWVQSFPYPLSFLFASKPEAIGPVLGIVQRVVAGWLTDDAGIARNIAQTGAVTLTQRFGSAISAEWQKCIAPKQRQAPEGVYPLWGSYKSGACNIRGSFKADSNPMQLL